MASFPRSRTVARLNEPGHGDIFGEMDVTWCLMTDESRFHVYVVAQLPDVAVRIDWRVTSRLEFEKYTPNDKDECMPIGQAPGFCRDCIIHTMHYYLQQYQLLKFNCRTVSYLILTEACGFDPTAVYEQLETRQMLCGLGNQWDCLALPEIHHYISWKHAERRRENEEKNKKTVQTNDSFLLY